MKHYQAIIISDLHLGTKDSKAEEFIEFLDNQDFIAGVPLNMELDQARIDTGEMSWQSYMKKWHNTDIEYSAMPSSN
jgi:hypothetical protein